MTTVKLSYSILNTWMQGRFEEAIAHYLGKPFPATPAMELGKLKHELWEEYIKENKALPEELGGGELRDPVSEQKYQKIIPLNEDIQILVRGVIDLEDQDIITDFKCGLSEPGSYLSGWQLDMYKLLRPNAKEGRIICFNPYADTYSVGVKFLNDSHAEKAMENIITFGSEMIEYLKANKLLIDFKENI